MYSGLLAVHAIIRPAGMWKDVYTFDIKDEYGLMPTLGGYRVCHELGSGMTRSTVYLAEHVETSVQAALKWPVEIAEVTTMTEIGRQLPGHPGLPVLLATGVYKGSAYFVMELLGSELSESFQCLAYFAPQYRWRAVSVIGRLLLRRLWAIHRCGYVHGDVAPQNILVGSTGEACPCLVDFGCARRFPGDGPVPGHVGSQEYSSARSADGGERLPVDDLEALGWVLVSGVFGELPWFSWLGELYSIDRTSDAWKEESSKVMRRVQEAKASLLNQGWDSLGCGWDMFTSMPSELDTFIHACQASSESQASLDYLELFEILGSDPDLGEEAAEEADMEQFRQLMSPLLDAVAEVKKTLQLQGDMCYDVACRDAIDWPPSSKYLPGQAVHVWSALKSTWIEDGFVQNVLLEDSIVDGAVLPKESVQVVYDNGEVQQWLAPEELLHLLAPREERGELPEDLDHGFDLSGQDVASKLDKSEDTPCPETGLIPCSFCDALVCTEHPAICASCWPLWLAEENEEEVDMACREN